MTRPTTHQPPRHQHAIFGRERELAVADAFLETAVERFAVLRLEGEAGIGKTTVWRAVVRRAVERGFFVLSCRPAEAETKLALSAVADLFEPVPSELLARLPRPQRHALDVALLRAEPGGTTPDPRTLATGVRTLLAELAVERRLLVAIDDVQWLDGSSAAALQFALRRLAGSRLGWLFARRDRDPAPLAADALMPPGSLTRQAIGPLTLAALHHVIKDRLDQPLSRPMLVRVHRASGGNPLFALEIARELGGSTSPDVGTPPPVPDGLREMLAGRIPRLPEEAREALLAAAALSDPTPALVERASSAEGLAAAEASGLIRLDNAHVVFSHPLYASAAYETASRVHREALHRRLAELVTDFEERARHLAIAVTDPDESVAQRIEQGAALARSRGAWGSAAELLERARRLTPSDFREEGQRRGIAAAEHHVHAGERARGRSLLDEILAEHVPRPLRADALRLLAEISYNDGDSAEAGRLFSEALAHTDEPRLAATIELGLSYLSGQRADPPSGTVHARRALAQAEASGEDALVAAALAQRAVYDFLVGRGVDWEGLERSLALEDPVSIMPLLWRPSTIAAILHLYVGHHSEARRRLTAVWTAARERGDESDLGFILLWLGWLETRSGNLSVAATLAEEAASVATLTGSRATLANVLAQRALVRAQRGDVEATRRDCAEAAALSEPLGAPWVGVWISATLGLLELSLGNPGGAWEACRQATEAIEQRGIAEPVPAFFLPDALEALIAVGELDRAEALLDSFEARGRELDRSWALATGARCRGLLLAARGDVHDADAALEQAIREHERLEMPFELARTLLARGVVERRARRRGRARASLLQAVGMFDRMGASLWAERAREELGRLGLRRSARDELTQSERRVAELAAQGLTNREVAAALFISPKTVEANLSRAYRKLGIGSRAELGARMAETPQK